MIFARPLDLWGINIVGKGIAKMLPTKFSKGVLFWKNIVKTTYNRVFYFPYCFWSS